MKIGIDISQIAHERTGVANYTKSLVENLLRIDNKNKYILFFSSLRKKCPAYVNGWASKPNVKLKHFRLPPTLLDFLWNRLHILPIEWFVGKIDVLFTSDWVVPPAKAKKVTTLHDLIVYKNPQEMNKKIVQTQRRKLNWVKKESKMIVCVSQATKKDAMEILGIEEGRLKVIYQGG
jgi:glycosyltransferase involved in cell wall biosynthesis